MDPLLDRFLGGLLIFLIGLGAWYLDKVTQAERQREIDEYRDQFTKQPRSVRFLELAQGFFGSVGPRISGLILSPMFSWVMMVLGLVCMGDAFLRMNE